MSFPGRPFCAGSFSCAEGSTQGFVPCCTFARPGQEIQTLDSLLLPTWPNTNNHTAWMTGQLSSRHFGTALGTCSMMARRRRGQTGHMKSRKFCSDEASASSTDVLFYRACSRATPSDSWPERGFEVSAVR